MTDVFDSAGKRSTRPITLRSSVLESEVLRIRRRKLFHPISAMIAFMSASFLSLGWWDGGGGACGWVEWSYYAIQRALALRADRFLVLRVFLESEIRL